MVFGDRETFGAEELASCLSHYDLGVIKTIKTFPRGSRRAPKVLIETERGMFLFKRRARGKDDLAKVAFTHQIQLTLANQNFPLPRLIRTCDDDNPLLVLDSKIYEMFEYVTGRSYDGSLKATYHAGHVLGLYHKLLENFKSDYRPPRGSYHNANAIHKAVHNTVSSLPLEKRPPSEVITQTVGKLEDVYKQCADDAENLGLTDWPEQIVHGDWHPGNMLFRDRNVVAVIDYDAARIQPRVIDLANGALQFSILGGNEDPSKWPEYVDESRFKRFLRGYDSVCVVSKREIQAVPYLMCEAMIAEAVLPIAATGSFGRMDGFPFLQMVERKIDWILSHHQELHAILED